MLWHQCRENGWLLTEDYDRYDMREAVMKSELTGQQVKELTRELYRVFLAPKYVARKVLSIRSKDDLMFARRGVGYIYGHLKDFARGSEMREEQAASVHTAQDSRGRLGE